MASKILQRHDSLQKLCYVRSLFAQRKMQIKTFSIESNCLDLSFFNSFILKGTKFIFDKNRRNHGSNVESDIVRKGRSRMLPRHGHVHPAGQRPDARRDARRRARSARSPHRRGAASAAGRARTPVTREESRTASATASALASVTSAQKSM